MTVDQNTSQEIPRMIITSSPIHNHGKADFPVWILFSLTLTGLKAVIPIMQLRHTGTPFFHLGTIPNMGLPHSQQISPMDDRLNILSLHKPESHCIVSLAIAIYIKNIPII
jgi:hypothetical protein